MVLRLADTRFAGAVALLLSATAPIAAEAQLPPRSPRLCYLAYVPSAPHDGAFLQGLRDLGYAEGRNLTIDFLSAAGRFDRFPALAEQCVRLRADVIVALTTPGALAAKKATSTIPIVSGPTGDPVGMGIVASLARPGGNVTGLTQMSPGLSGKRLELLREAVPRISRVSLLANLSDPIAAAQVQELEAAARSLGVQLRIRNVNNPEQLATAFAAAAREQDEALLTTIETIFLVHRARVLELAAKYKLPAMYPYREVTDAGGLMSYGPNRLTLYRRMAVYVDKILKGAQPADLPVEQPTEFELVINLKTAKALGLTIPPSLLLQAHQVIE
jgi:putative ABC transport system substrate-binding protein